MTASFHIRRIRLLNFHNLVDETLTVRRNLFLIGDNQSGKTTVLDAVHFAVSAGVEMEFNAAARFGPRTETGRSLASIVLRYDLERDVALRGPSVMYAVLEIADDTGAAHTFGAGAFATSLDAQPDVWGFVARGKSLDDLALCGEETDGSGVVHRRPRDRQELEEQLGRGAVFDKGRYRTAVAQLLFRDRDAYERALELVAAGKAYREMVARARNLDDLFIGLLPPPAETEFEEVRSAPRAIEGIRSDLADLDAELGVMRLVIEKLQEARRETEKIARYEFVGAELAHRLAAAELELAQKAAETARIAAERAEKAKERAANDVATQDIALQALRASEGANLLAREEESRHYVAEAKGEVTRATAEVASRTAESKHAHEDASKADVALDAAKSAASVALQSIAEAAREHLDDAAVVTVGMLANAIAALEPGRPPNRPAIERPVESLTRRFEDAQRATADLAAVAEGDARRLRGEADATLNEANEVRRRAEVLPDLPGFSKLLSALEAQAGRAVPLYRLFGLRPTAPESLGAGIECLLGPRILGAIVVPPEEHASARALVLAHGGGAEVVDPSEFALAGGSASAGTLPASLIDAASSPLMDIARKYMERVAGDVRVLSQSEARGDAERAVWSDGHIYERGAESRVEPAAPRFLGAEARARAAAEEEARLRVRAEQLNAAAKRSDDEASARRQVAAALRVTVSLLGTCAPTPLIGVVVAAESARGRVRERESAARSAGERLARDQEKLSKLVARHKEIAAAVASAGVADLRSRIARMEAGVQKAREAEKKAIDEASRQRTEADQSASKEEVASKAATAASEQAQVRREALLPLVESRFRSDIEDYAFRIMRGNQIRAENVADIVAEADRARVRAFQWLDSSDGLRNERLWQKYAFRVNETEREIRDQTGRPVEDVFEQREAEVQSLRKALDERTRDLLERVVMAGLVRRLQGQVRELRDTIRGINELAADLRFGMSEFQFSLRNRPEFQRLLDLLREQSVLQPALREELRDFFQARLDDLRQAREGEVPEILDYRRWFEYVLQVQSRGEGAAQDLPRQRLRFGSTGEQAVPTYLLVIAVASLLYDRTDARLRLLLLDEAFLGIDAGRREVLMQFADRAGIDLIIATPELDGVTPALAASSTLFIQKTPEQDVFVSDYHWERPDAQQALFDRPAEPTESDLELGGTRPAPEAGENDGAVPQSDRT